MAKINFDTRLKTELAIENRKIKQPQRRHIGASAIGAPCARAIWYSFHWASERTITPRQARLFSRGHREEPIVIKDLEDIGVKILTRQESVKFCNGHAGGSSDGRIIGIPDAPKTEHLLEIKTASKKRFEALLSCNSYQKWSQGYYDQIQIYMNKFRLVRALVIVVCKDDDRRYYERIKYDKNRAELLLNKFWSIIEAKQPPHKNGNSPSEWPCIFCDHQETCWYGKPIKNCRTCIHLEPIENGKWKCQRKRKNIKHKKQKKACSHYQANC